MAQLRAEAGSSACRMPTVPAWKAPIERNADENSSVVSQCPRRSVASRPITVTSRALATTRLICIGDEVRSTQASTVGTIGSERFPSLPTQLGIRRVLGENLPQAARQRLIAQVLCVRAGRGHSERRARITDAGGRPQRAQS